MHGSADGVADDQPRPGPAPGRRPQRRRCAQLTAHELRRIDLGHGQSFCSLAEALDAFPETRFNIDIKSADAVARTVEAIRATRADEPRAHRLVQRPRGAWRRSASCRASRPRVSAAAVLRPSLPRARAPVAAHAGCCATCTRCSCPRRLLGWRLDRDAARDRAPSTRRASRCTSGRSTTPDQMERLLDAGVDGIVTDRADLALPIVAARRRGSLSASPRWCPTPAPHPHRTGCECSGNGRSRACDPPP